MADLACVAETTSHQRLEYTWGASWLQHTVARHRFNLRCHLFQLIGDSLQHTDLSVHEI